ncbi:hypothetical protein Pcinc_009954 [Petrolisthes cinctipes]|uniref:Uncharacterized protein n=1 Tax=Petrolisthes cinctipes TaxID=88211 RepID=A0AAE1G3Q1_PETCI|nr:hypothetical protein Pcinc_009954 [Petrolisthes cinctipes]
MIVKSRNGWVEQTGPASESVRRRETAALTMSFPAGRRYWTLEHAPASLTLTPRKVSGNCKEWRRSWLPGL